MKRSAIFLLIGMAVLTARNANAGSAVAMEPHHGHLVYSYGHRKEIDERQALELARSLYGADVRIIAASEVAGYGAIAVAAKGNRAVIGISLGRPSSADAADRAIEQCLISGGANPKVRWRFRG